MQTYEAVRAQIGEWSQKNFGGQETPYLQAFAAGNIRPGTKRSKEDKPGHLSTMRRVVALGSLAPLMGLMEEVGELFTAKHPADVKDALGDIAVYLCDYLSRERLTWPISPAVHPVPYLPPLNGVVATLGTLYHCHLKRFQRIRDMHDDMLFESKRGEALRYFVMYLEELAKESAKDDLLVLLNETWNNIVSKRDWKKDAAVGGGATHENVVGGVPCTNVVNEATTGPVNPVDVGHTPITE